MNPKDNDAVNKKRKKAELETKIKKLIMFGLDAAITVLSPATFYFTLPSKFEELEYGFNKIYSYDYVENINDFIYDYLTEIGIGDEAERQLEIKKNKLGISDKVKVKSTRVPLKKSGWFKPNATESQAKNISHYGNQSKEKMRNREQRTPSKNNLHNKGFCLTHVSTTIGLVIVLCLMVFKFIGDYGGLITKIPALISPFFIFLGVFRIKWLSKHLKGKIGGFIILGFLAVLLALIPLFHVVFSAILVIALLYVIYVIYNIFAPSSCNYIKITITDENGHTTEETRVVYGDIDVEVKSVENELRSQGYTDIRRG